MDTGSSGLLRRGSLVDRLGAAVTTRARLVRSLGGSRRTSHRRVRGLLTRISCLAGGLFNASDRGVGSIRNRLGLFSRTRRRTSISLGTPIVGIPRRAHEGGHALRRLFGKIPSQSRVVSLPRNREIYSRYNTTLRPVNGRFMQRRFHFAPTGNRSKLPPVILCRCARAETECGTISFFSNFSSKCLRASNCRNCGGLPDVEHYSY